MRDANAMPDTRENSMPKLFRRSFRCLALLCALPAGLMAHSETAPRLARVKDVATIEGIRDNQLVGYGLVVGLRGTGDSSQTVFLAQSLVCSTFRFPKR